MLQMMQQGCDSLHQSHADDFMAVISFFRLPAPVSATPAQLTCRSISPSLTLSACND
jgi:hypothetical protein